MKKKYCDLCGKEIKDRFIRACFIHKIQYISRHSTEIYRDIYDYCPDCYIKMEKTK